MCKSKLIKISRCYLLATLSVLYGCDTSSPHNDLAQPGSSTSEQSEESLNDLTNYAQLFGSFSAFERVTISAPFGSNSIQIDYTNIESNETHSQISMRNADGKYDFIVLPISEETSEFVEISSGTTIFGQITILPLGLSDPNYIPGQFALDAMNSILMGLRDEIAASDLSTSTNTGSPEERQKESISAALQKSVNHFQSLIALLDDSVVFNSPVVDPNSGEAILDSRGLGILDSIYLTLLNNFTNDLLFLDEETDTQTESTSSPRLSFSQINNAATARFGTLDGINALTSLSMYTKAVNPSSTVNQFVNATSFVSAGLIPAIVTNYVRNFNETLSFENLSSATSILNSANEASGFEYSFMYTEALNALQTLTAELITP